MLSAKVWIFEPFRLKIKNKFLDLFDWVIKVMYKIKFKSKN